MKSTVEHVSPTRVKINIEVPFEELKPDFDAAYKQLAQQIRVPGFRPGKAPAKIIEARVGRMNVLNQVVNDALPAKYNDALTSTDLKPLGQPDIEITKLEDGEDFTFTAEVDVRPEIALPDYSAIAVTVDPVEIDDAAVDEQLQSLRERFGTLTGVDRAARTGDFVSIDLSATVDGEDVPEASTEGLSHEVGSGQLIEGLDEAIVGLSVDGSTEFTTTLVAGAFAGREAQVTVTVKSIKERELPEADDEFAQLASEFDTLDELLADLRERVGRVKKVEQAGQIRDKVLEHLLDTLEIPVPEAFVQAEVDAAVHDAVHSLDHDEDALAAQLEAAGSSREEFDRNARENAEKSVKTQLLLDAIADAEKTQVGQEELTQNIIYQAQRYGISPDQFIAQIQQANQLPALFADIRRSKSLASIVDKVTVTDTTGATVDTAELFGGGDDSSDSAEAADAAGSAEGEQKA